jgi:hypothetical protein
VSETLDPIGVALRVTAVLDTLGVRYTIGGSIASSVAGEPRSTLDIDLVAELDATHVEFLVRSLEGDFYLDAAAIRRAVDQRRSVNLIHHTTQLKIDLFVAGGTPIDGLQLSRRREVEIDGRRLFVHPPEDILLQKLRWLREGGESSDRQWRDVLGVVRVQGSRLDIPYLKTQAEVLGVSDLLARALSAGGVRSETLSDTDRSS